MINLRYHIVSITAVFLALGIGLALGGTFLDRYTVDQLERNITSVEERIREIRVENERLAGRNEAADARDRALVESAAPALVGELLADVPVLVVAPDGIDERSLQDLTTVLGASGARFEGVLTMTDDLALDDETAGELADALELDDRDPASVRDELVTRLAAALSAAALDDEDAGGTGGSDGPSATTTTAVPPTTAVPAPTDPTTPGVDPQTPPTTARPPDGPSDPGADGDGDGDEGSSGDEEPEVPTEEPEIVSVLRDAGLLSYTPPEGVDDDAPVLDSGGHRYVFVSGPEPSVPNDVVLLPVLRAMSEEGPTPVVLASAAVGEETERTRGAVVGPVREDDELSASVSTVDDLETFNGLVATLLALDQLADDVHGHYGEGEGATAPFPAP